MSQEEACSEAAREVEKIRSALYERYGHGAITRAAEEVGKRREQVSHLLSRNARETLDKLAQLAREREAG